MSKKDWKAKGKGGQLPPFVPMFRHVHKTKAWAALSATDKAVYIEIKLRFNGGNNGQIALSARELADLNNISKNTAARSVKRLCEVGLLAIETPSGFGTNGRRATEYRLTDHPTSIAGKQSAPTKEFEKWEPKNKSQCHQRDVSVSPQGHEGPERQIDDHSCITTGTRRGVLTPSSVSPQGHSIDIPSKGGDLHTPLTGERAGRKQSEPAHGLPAIAPEPANAEPGPKHLSESLKAVLAKAGGR